MKDLQSEEDHQYMASPWMSSYETTPGRVSSVSEPVSFSHSPLSSDASPTFKTNKEDPTPTGSKKVGRKGHNYAFRIREHVRMGAKISETVKGKLSLGARIIQQGGRENIFRNVFGVSAAAGEKLLKASQCYLSTTAGPIAGILFVSTAKVAFCSERSIALPSSSGHLIRSPYKVSIPIEKIKRANESENVNKPTQKYIQIITEDDFEFWFMGFVRYEKAFMNLQKAISMSR